MATESEVRGARLATLRRLRSLVDDAMKAENAGNNVLSEYICLAAEAMFFTMPEHSRKKTDCKCCCG